MVDSYKARIFSIRLFLLNGESRKVVDNTRERCLTVAHLFNNSISINF